jgi:hypothetical protein
MDRAARTGGLRFLLAFAGWATLAFVPAWFVSHAWQHALGAVAARAVAPSGTELEMLELELFYPMDLAVFVALCLASGWATWRSRARALLVGTPIMIAAEFAALAVALATLLAASDPTGAAGAAMTSRQAEALRLTDALIRVTGLAIAAAVWFALLGREQLRVRRGHRLAMLLFLAVPLLTSTPAAAHGVGTSQLHMRIDGKHIEGTWDLNVHDARLALGLPVMPPGEAAWQDLRPHEPELRALLLRSLTIQADSTACTIALTPAPMEWNREFDYVKFHVVAECPTAPTRLAMHCELLFDIDPKHRAYFSVEDARAINVGAFRTHERSVAFAVRQFHLGEIVWEFVRDGMWHIWTGLDHMLFLLALLLPAALIRTGGTWIPRPGLWASTREVLKVVTAFTLAHSLTLCLSFFGFVRLPQQWIEVGIALSVFAAAWNNLRPFLPGRAWAMALGFGLVHGLGFAGALQNLSLPRHARVLALGAFNVGVEVGQIAIVAAMLPLLYVASRRSWYPRFVMGLGSLAIAWLAIVWVLERGFSLSLFSGR